MNSSSELWGASGRYTTAYRERQAALNNFYREILDMAIEHTHEEMLSKLLKRINENSQSVKTLNVDLLQLNGCDSYERNQVVTKLVDADDEARKAIVAWCNKYLAEKVCAINLESRSQALQYANLIS
jgi:ankyrin repeat protein